ncbi:nonsense-mediated mRNA decay protein 2-like [Salvia miltiorrhiza]|uniref:nonsense-mediated mRNA decay protein 2-like n=1 Tax=Salvia miltiorrhiza TaxID=226208 RepID=UPI0025ACFEC4|nr:nonsense-mediated mRNA decay protein 2-like [Salvia miltiorrhiza]
MDQKDAEYYYINQTHNFYLKKTLQFLLPISIISFLVSYFSVFSLLFHSLDRKCMFLLCNGILAFLAKSLTSPLTHGEKNFDDEDALFFRENAAYVEYVDHTSSAVPEEIEIKVQDDSVSQNINAAEEIETEMVTSEEWEGDEDEDEDDDNDDDDGEQVQGVVSDMRVSTEELNKKFDEFIRKMKEEIRIEARQQYLIAV